MFGLIELEYRFDFFFFFGGGGKVNIIFINILYIYVMFRLHNENQLDSLPGSASKVPVVVFSFSSF
jgi:hypothetical protein